MIDQDRAVTIRDAKWNGAEITENSTPGRFDSDYFVVGRCLVRSRCNY